MEKELYYTNNKLISKLNIYFNVNPSQINDGTTADAGKIQIINSK